MVEFTPIASSSRGNAYVLKDGATPLLLEAGLRGKELRRRTGFRLGDFAACLATHEHQDHAKGIADVMQAGVDCYLSQGTIDTLRIAGHRLHPIRALEQFQVGTWTILPFEAVHDAAEPLGFLLTNSVKKILFATDTHYIKHRFKGLTHICIECNFDATILKENAVAGAVNHDMAKRLWDRHMSLRTVQEMLAANDLSQVEEIHLLHLSDANSDEKAFREAIMRQTGKPVYVAPA